MRNPEEREASLALRSGRGNRLRARGRLVPHPRTGCTPAIRSRWPPTRSGIPGRPRDGEGFAAGLRHLGDRRRAQPAPARHPHHRRAHRPGRAEIRSSGSGTSSSAAATTPPSTCSPGTGHRGGDARRSGPQRQPLAGHRRRPAIQSHRRRTTHRPTPASSSTTTICASTSRWATRSPCTPPKASPPTPPTPSSEKAPPAPWPTWPLSRGRDTNQAYIYTRDSAEIDHDHTHPIAGDELHRAASRHQILSGASRPQHHRQRRTAPHHARRGPTDRPPTTPRYHRPTPGSPRPTPDRPSRSLASAQRRRTRLPRRWRTHGIRRG